MMGGSAGARPQFSRIETLVTTLCEKMRASLHLLVVADVTLRAAKSRFEVACGECDQPLANLAKSAML